MIEYPQIKGIERNLYEQLNKRFKDDMLLHKKDYSFADPTQLEIKCEIKTQSADVFSIFIHSYFQMQDAASSMRSASIAL